MPQKIEFSQSPFPYDPAHTGIAIAYRNATLIADEVFPRIMVPKQAFKYRVYPAGQSITVPNTMVGRKSELNQVEMTFEEVDSSTRDFGLKDIIPNEDFANAPEGYDPTGSTIEYLTDLILLDREIRAANLVFNADSFAAGHKATLESSGQWSHADSHPIAAIEAALNVPMARPNILTIGQAAWSVLRQHPEIVAAVNKNSGESGLATRKAVAELFELEDVIVGQGWVNTAKAGQAVTRARVWGKHAALIHRNRLAGTDRGVTFGFTAQFGTRIGGERDAPNVGLHGAKEVVAGESVRELISAPDLGYLFLNAVA